MLALPHVAWKSCGPQTATMQVDFWARAFEWRGPAPYVFVALPPDAVEAVGAVARAATYGWGCITVTATIGETTWSTSLMPHQGGYVLPLKVAVRRAEGLDLGDDIEVHLVVPV